MTRITRSYTVAYAKDFQNELQGWKITSVESSAGVIEFHILRNGERRIVRLASHDIFFSMTIQEDRKE